MNVQAPKDVFRQELDVQISSLDAKIAALKMEQKELERADTVLHRQAELNAIRSSFVSLRIADADESKQRILKLAAAATAPMLNDTTRDAVRREQALRARLSKTDMNKEARRKVLEDGRDAGILTPAESAELERALSPSRPSLSVTVRSSTPVAEPDATVLRKKRRATVTRQEKRATKKRKVPR